MKIITLQGQVVSQKNSKQIAFNKATGRRFVMSNQRVKDWQEYVGFQLLQYGWSAPDKCSIFYHFYVKDNIARDLDNMIASVNDALVKGGIIKSDAWQYLSIDGAKAEIDRSNPRVRLIISYDS